MTPEEALEQAYFHKSMLQTLGSIAVADGPGKGTMKDRLLKAMDIYAESQCAPLREEIERLKSGSSNAHAIKLYDYCKELEAEIERLKGDKWISVKDRLPDKNKEDCKVLVYKRYHWERRGKTGTYYEIETLVYNQDHECWDNEDGDDYNCDIDRVLFWQPRPEPPTINL